MTQFNPPPGNVPPGFSAPPRYPGHAGHGPPAYPTTSVAAIVSLICGILGCFILPAIIAIIAGIVGIAATSNPNVRGRGMAIAGLVLGLIFGAIGVLGGYSIYWGVGKLKEVASQQMQPFVNAIVDGDFTKAAEYTSMSPEELESLRQQMRDWGRVSSVAVSGFDARKVDGRDTLALNGTATFSRGGDRKFTVMLDDGGAGKLRIVKIEFEPSQ
ncbi:MAG: DUF4190 domain-containing protein [Phycisphaerae bacterium]|nr:DUF4190 domain-containing protein [Phycisphaerae bacterium]MDW8262439.1 DUF4190 domain-containing protein [Phycisphaerales bacterium]